MDEKRKLMWEFAFGQFQEPYVWGGDGPDKWDCSGFVLATLRSVELWDKTDTTAQGIYNRLSQNGESVIENNEIKPMDIIFYGDDVDKITHVGLCLGNNVMIGANGSKLRGGVVDFRNMYYHPKKIVAIIDPVVAAKNTFGIIV